MNLVPNSPGESPPRPPRALFGRDELLEEIVCLVDKQVPIALIGVGGIGKTSISLAALHHDRIKERFRDNRRFIRCDQFQPTAACFLSRLSEVVGAGVENPESLALLRPFLSSRKMLVVLDNAESILDPQGTNAQDVYAAVEELSQFDNICLFITSRISIVPPNCETFDIQTLSMEAARDTFCRIYKNGKRSEAIDNILKKLEFHPLSTTLLATVAHQNKWDTIRLIRESEDQRTGVLRTDDKRSLAATIELSLASPMFQELGPDARAILEVVAFFPQGIDENNLDWLFPTVYNRKNIFDKFCVLSLTHRTDGFATMLAPLRDHLYPKDPKSSPLLCATKGYYFSRLSVRAEPNTRGFEETRWIVSEEVNVEHLLGVFTSVDANSKNVWSACANFMQLLRWNKPRLTVLGSKVERLPDGFPPKSRCLDQLALTFDSLGNYPESRRLLAYALKLRRERGDDHTVAQTLKCLAYVNLRACLYAEGIPQAKEALEIYEKLDDTAGQAVSLRCLALLLVNNNQVDAAEEAASRAIRLSSDEPSQSQVCEHHHTLGYIYSSRGETEVAIGHLQTALGIATSLDSQIKRATILRYLVQLLLKEGRLDDALVHLERLELDAVNNLFSLGLAAMVQVCVWRREGRFEEAESEVSRIIAVYEKAGMPTDFLECGKGFPREVEEKMNNPVAILVSSPELCHFSCQLILLTESAVTVLQMPPSASRPHSLMANIPASLPD